MLVSVANHIHSNYNRHIKSKPHILATNGGWTEQQDEDSKTKYKDMYKNNKEQLTTCTIRWRVSNPDKIKEYYERNKEKMSLKKNEPYACECGVTMRSDSRSQHMKTKAHIQFMGSKQQPRE